MTNPVGEAVLIVHGLAEHAGRYAHVADALTRAGCDVWAMELRGHGESEGRRGHVDRWKQYVDDVRAVARRIGRPVFLLGHSMGALVCLEVLRSGQLPDIMGLALSNPLLGVAVRAPWIKLKGAGLLSSVWPTLSLGNELDPRHISRDPEVVEAYEADPLVYDTITSRWYTEMRAAQGAVMGHSRRFAAPLLLLLGTGDKICDAETARAFFDAYGGADKDLAVFEGFYHELFNELEKDRVLAELILWLQRKTGFTTDIPGSWKR